jgi:hypothetical protein
MQIALQTDALRRQEILANFAQTENDPDVGLRTRGNFLIFCGHNGEVEVEKKE